MKKTLLVLGLIIMLSLIVSSSVWAAEKSIFASDIYQCDTKVNLHYKFFGFKNLNMIIDKDNESFPVSFAIGTAPPGSDVDDVLNATVSGAHFTDCFLMISDLTHFEACFTLPAVVNTDTNSKDGKPHNEKFSIIATGVFTSDLNTGGFGGDPGNISLLCDNVTMKDNDLDIANHIKPSQCKLQGGFSEVFTDLNTTNLGVHPGYTFTGTLKNCTMDPL